MESPVQVTLIGTGDGGAWPLDKMTVRTPGEAPHVVFKVVGPVLAITVRFINTFLTILVGLVVAGMTPVGNELLGADDFLALVQRCALLSLPGAGVGLLKDLVTVFGRLEAKYPLLTGSV